MKKYLIYTFIISIIGFGFYNKAYIPKHTYKIVSATKSNMSVRVNGIGNVSAKNIYKIGSIYGGKILNLIVNEGDFINKGTTIAIIDSVDLQDKISEQISLVAKLNSDIKSLKIDKKSAITSYNYQNEIYMKNAKLYKKRAISQLDFIKYKTSKDIAKLQISTIESKVESLKNQANQLKFNIKGLKEKLSRYTIVAPVSGYIVQKSVSNYQIISPNQTIIEIVNPDDVWVRTNIDTRMSGNIKIGNSATLKLRSSKTKLLGKIVNIKPINNNVTNEREVNVAFNNLPIPFYLEEQVIVNIDINKLNNIVTIPTKALTIYNEQNGVWVVDNNHKVKFQPLKIIAYENKKAAVKNFDINNKIVMPNPKNKDLKDGMTIIND